MSRPPRWLPLLPPSLALAVVLLACGGGGGAPGDTADPVALPFGLETRPVLAPLAFPDTQPPPTAVGLERAFPNLTFRRPVFLTTAPTGRPGSTSSSRTADPRVRERRRRDRRRHLPRPARAVRAVSRASNEEGLLGLAFDPDVGRRGRARLLGLLLGVGSATLRGRALRRDVSRRAVRPWSCPSSGAVVLEVAQPYTNHNAGMLAFGPDDMLYVALGDGGSGNDPDDNGQDLSTLLADDPAARRARAGHLRRALRQPLRRSAGRARRDLGVRPAQPLALLVRPRHRGPVGRRRRAGRARGGRSSSRGRELRLARLRGRALEPQPDRPADRTTSSGRSSTTRAAWAPRPSAGTSTAARTCRRSAARTSTATTAPGASGRSSASGGAVLSNEQIANVSQVASFGEDHAASSTPSRSAAPSGVFREPAGGTPPVGLPRPAQRDRTVRRHRRR